MRRLKVKTLGDRQQTAYWLKRWMIGRPSEWLFRKLSGPRLKLNAYAPYSVHAACPGSTPGPISRRSWTRWAVEKQEARIGEALGRPPYETEIFRVFKDNSVAQHRLETVAQSEIITEQEMREMDQRVRDRAAKKALEVARGG